MTTTTLFVQDMRCNSCVSRIRDAIEASQGVLEVVFNPVKKQVFVHHTEQIGSDHLIQQLTQLGFPATLSSPSGAANTDLLKRLGVAAFACMQVMMVHVALYAGELQGMQDTYRRLLEYVALAFCLPAVTYAAVPFYRNAITWRGTQGPRFRLNMDSPVALAILSAFSISFYNTLYDAGPVYYDSVVMFTALLLGARFFDQRLRSNFNYTQDARAALPQTAIRIVNGCHTEIPAAHIDLDDKLWIAPGAMIPVDGTVCSHSAILDEAVLSGEIEPRTLAKGAKVYGGTLNVAHGFVLRASATIETGKLNLINQMAEQALLYKHNLLSLADRIAQWFIPSIIVLALSTFIGWQIIDSSRAIEATLAVLVISCPCALSLAVPAAITATVTRLRQAGLLVKNTLALERAAKLHTIVFDKTGTLTHPAPQIVKTEVATSLSEDQCLAYASTLQKHSQHPLATAFVKPMPLQAEAEEVEIQPRGVRGTIEGHRVAIGDAAHCQISARPESDNNKLVYLTIDDELAAIFTLTLTLREDAQCTIKAIQQFGLDTQLLSGDQPAQCAEAASQLNMDYQAQAQPEEKFHELQRLQRQGPIMFVGDGVNDLPALAQADVSVATLETSDLVKSKADVILLSDRLSVLVDFLNVGRRSRRVLQQNLFWALAYNLTSIPCAAFGLMPPWLAAAGMSISSILVLANSSRLLRTPIGDTQCKA
jgi:Cu2+-exporting ATPase